MSANNILPLPCPESPAPSKAVPLLLPQPQAIQFLGTSRSGWYRLKAADKRFPKAVNVPGVGPMWRAEDLRRYVECLKAAR